MPGASPSQIHLAEVTGLDPNNSPTTDAGPEHLRGTRATSQAVARPAEAGPRCRVGHGGVVGPKKK